MYHLCMSRNALCLYGHYRSFNDCYKNLKANVLDPNNITDIFAFLWIDSIGWFKHPELSIDPKNHCGYEESVALSTNSLINVLNKLNPKRLSFENYDLKDDYFSLIINDLADWHHPNVYHRPKGTLSQVYGRCTSIRLKDIQEKQQGWQYDKVIVTRWDIDYGHPIILDGLNSDVITMDGMYGSEVISDAWACGDSHQISLWGQQFNGISTLVKNQTMNLGPHEWLKAWFDHMQIKWFNDSSVGITIRR